MFNEACSAFPGAGDCEAYVGTAALRALRGGACVALFINAGGGGDHDCDGINIHSFKIFRLIPIDTPSDTRAVWCRSKTLNWNCTMDKSMNFTGNV